MTLIARLALLLLALTPALPANAEDVASIPVSARMIERGTILSEGDLVLASQAQVGPRPFVINDISRLVGQELRRTMPAGQPFYANDVRVPAMIRKGEMITMIVQRGGMTIAAAGKALEDGGRDQMIRVQNVGSRRTIEARVAGPGQVSVQPMHSIAALRPAG